MLLIINRKLLVKIAEKIALMSVKYCFLVVISEA